MKTRRRKALHETVELNITAFLNLMVVLVPFLLITAVFSRMTILELTLPLPGDGSSADEEIRLELQLLVDPEYLELRDAHLGRIGRFEGQDGEFDMRPLVNVLTQLKSRFPDEQSIALLLDNRVSYRQLIEVMDQVRTVQMVNQGTLEEYELFPNIAIGDAPDTEASGEEVSLEQLESVHGAEGDDNAD